MVDNTVAPDHVGIVAALNGTPLIIIEGSKDEKVTCYRYYSYYIKNKGTVLLYVKDKDGVLGYCSKKYLK